MRLLFVENRFKTFFWSEIVKKLRIDHDNILVSWIVQNKKFKPKDEDCFVINYPESSQLNFNYNSDFFEKLAKMDRGVYAFDSGTSHYYYYYESIKNYIKKFDPNFVIGESTLFHELITIEVCKELGIKYITPSTCRYPVGKFSLYVNGTLDILNYRDYSVANCHNQMIEDVVCRNRTPDYMKKQQGLKSIIFKSRLIYNKFFSLLSWIEGERYNTPSPFKKMIISIENMNNKKDFERISLKDYKGIDWENTVLYPLQMQPESNIDVWGHPYNDQTINLKRLIERLPPGKMVLIKPNPKSKYELSSELVSLISSLDNVHAISSDISMDDIFDKVKTIYTVTGTIAIEAILAGKSVITENSSKLLGYPNVSYLDSSEIKLSIPIYSKESLMSNLDGNSNFGLISDPIFSDYSVSIENIENICSALYYELELDGLKK